MYKKEGVPWELMVGNDIRKYAVDIHGAKGLPTTSDMQLFLALEDVVAGVIEREGCLPFEPLRIRPSALLQSSDRINGGKNYQAVGEFFDRMLGLVVYSYVWGQRGTGPIGAKGQRPPRFHIFLSILPPGSTKDDGSVSYLYEALYVGGGGARLQYDELVRLFVLPRYTAPSRIHQQLDQAHDELATLGLKSAHIQRTGKQQFEVIWEAGSKWYEMGQEMKKRDLLPDPGLTMEGLLPGGVPVDEGGVVSTADVERIVQEMIQFDRNGAKYENFYRRVASVLSRPMIYKVMADIRERLLTGWRPEKSRGAYFVGQLKNVAARHGMVLGQPPHKV